jgi:hypothetical protein
MRLCNSYLQVFKRLFPPDIFAAFIDVGHYNASLSAYTHLVQRLEGERATRLWVGGVWMPLMTFGCMCSPARHHPS